MFDLIRKRSVFAKYVNGRREQTVFMALLFNSIYPSHRPSYNNCTGDFILPAGGIIDMNTETGDSSFVLFAI
ncbi:MAG: hypothetical protein FWC06_02390 [Treponema sp.]|nr:hypothetical protein [Treponema sp.]